MDGLFDRTQEEIDLDRAYAISLRFLAEVELAMEARSMTRKELGEALGTSAAAITQLFRMNRLLNLKTIAKIERVLGLEFRIGSANESMIHWDETVKSAPLTLAFSQIEKSVENPIRRYYDGTFSYDNTITYGNDFRTKEIHEMAPIKRLKLDFDDIPDIAV